MRSRIVWSAALIALAPALAALGAARANDVNVNIGAPPSTATPGSIVVQPSPAPVVVQPAPPPVVVQPSPTVVAPSAQVIQADEIEATDVRAHTIYANKIEALEVMGSVHQTGRVKIEDAKGEIKTPSVVASSSTPTPSRRAGWPRTTSTCARSSPSDGQTAHGAGRGRAGLDPPSSPADRLTRRVFQPIERQRLTRATPGRYVFGVPMSRPGSGEVGL